MADTNTKWATLFVITTINVVVATAYAVLGMIAPSKMLPSGLLSGEAAHIFSLYAASRTLSLAAVVIYCVISRKRSAVITLGLLAGLVQFFDGFVGVYQNDLMKSVGPFMLAVLQFSSLMWVWKSAGDVDR